MSALCLICCVLSGPVLSCKAHASRCLIVLSCVMQGGNHANEGETSSTSQEENARVINMLRGGILYVKIRKGMDMENEDGLPSSARQVSGPTMPTSLNSSLFCPAHHKGFLLSCEESWHSQNWPVLGWFP